MHFLTLLQLHADPEDFDGVVEFVQWTLPDGTLAAADDVAVSIAAGEFYHVKLEAVDNDGLTGFDERTITVRRNDVRPPRIVSEPQNLASVYTAYVYDADGTPSVQGDRPMVWSLGRVFDGRRLNVPDGMVVNGQSGVITWTPASSQVGGQRVRL